MGTLPSISIKEVRRRVESLGLLLCDKKGHISALKETMYLLSSKTNRERLHEAVEQIEKMQYTKR